MIQIPLTSGPQTFFIGLGDYYWQITLLYRDSDLGGWSIDMERTDDGEQIFGIPVICGVDLLAQFQYRGIGHLYATVDGRYDVKPTYSDMGATLALYWEE